MMNTSPIISDKLATLGLDPREQAIYLAVLEMGEALQLPLAKRVGMQRTSLRELLPGLLARGILQERVFGKRTFLVARDPRDLIAEIKNKAEQAEQLLPQLLAMQNNLPDKPEVRFLQGVSGIKQMYEESLRIGQPIYAFLDVSSINPEIEQWLKKDYIPRREKAGILAYNLVNDSPKLTTLIPGVRGRMNKIIPRDKFPFPIDVLTFGDYVAFDHFSQHTEPSTILIRSKSAAVTLQSIHKALWEMY